MATCTLTLDIGYGPDEAATLGAVAIERLNRGDNGSMMVVNAYNKVPLTYPFPTVVLQQGITYRFLEQLPTGGKTVTATIPASSTAFYSDLTDLDPAGTILAPTALMASGSGSPEGVVTATPGVMYSDTAITLGAAVWRKNTGSGNTGWVVVSGDTGRRQVRSWDSAGVVTGDPFPAGWQPRTGVAGFVKVRRVNQLVRVTALNVSSVGSLGAAEVLYALPVGFQAVGSDTGGTIVPWWTSGSVLKQFSITDITARGSGAVSAAGDYSSGFSIQFLTDNNWPTSLPGVAA